MFLFGRGGAGNHYTKEEIREKAILQPPHPTHLPTSTDPLDHQERQIHAADPESQKHKVNDAPPPRATTNEYLHTGRGGAGNLLAPSEVEKELKDLSAPGSGGTHVDATEMPGSTNRAWRGRGGAGNFVEEGERGVSGAVLEGREVTDEGRGFGEEDDGLQKPEKVLLKPDA